MRALLDSGVWFRRFQSLPLSPQLRRTLAAVTEWHLSAYSVLEILHKWRSGRLPAKNPALWLDEALTDFIIHPVNVAVARRAALWDWEHGDPGDRVIAATAAEYGLVLVHTDRTLRDLPGFDQHYCRGVRHSALQ